MAAFLTFESQAQRVADWMPYLEDTRKTRSIDPKTGNVIRASIEVKPPDINKSGSGFTVVFDEDETPSPAAGHIRFGLKAIKGAGEKAIHTIVSEREQVHSDEYTADHTPKPYTSLFDFCERVPQSVANKAAVEAMIRCGAFDSLHGRELRAAMIATLPRAASAGQALAADRASGQGGLFGGGEETKTTQIVTETPLDSVDAWTEAEVLAQEKETLGFFVSSHPLDQWKPWIRAFPVTHTCDLDGKQQGTRILLAGTCQSIRTLVIRKGASAGQKMAIVTFDDGQGSCECVVFSDAYVRYEHLLKEDGLVFLIGDLDLSRGGPQVLVDRVLDIDMLPLERASSIDILFGSRTKKAELDTAEHDTNADSGPIDLGTMNLVHSSLSERARHAAQQQDNAEDNALPCSVRIFVSLAQRDRPVPIQMAKGWRVSPTPGLAQSLDELVGEGNYRFAGKVIGKPEREGRRYQKKFPVKGKVASA